MAILETFPAKSGHTITDDSSPITERESVNLIDFDVTDDSTNEQTDVTPHRLTSAELDEIVAGVPNGYNDMPVVYDERGTEYVIGKYIKADGSIVPLYKKMIVLTGSYSGNNSGAIIYSLGANTRVHWFYGVAYENGGSVNSIPQVNVQYPNSNFGIWVADNTGDVYLRSGSNTWNRIELNFYYYKTTD